MNRNSRSLLVGRMGKPKMRARGSNWNHAHTVALAELKREASLNKEDGRLVWDRIAQIPSSKFPGQFRTGDQCQGRWDILVKNYNCIKDYCVETGAQDHRELVEGELASMKLATAYQQDWYDMEQVCSQRKRKERCDRDLMLPRRRMGSHSVELPERPPNRVTLCPASTSKPVRHYEQSTTIYAQVSSSSSLEVDKLSPVEEVVRLMTENDCSMVEATQPRQHAQVSNEFFQEPQVTRHEQSTPKSTITYAQVSSSPSLEVDKLSPVEEVVRLINENDSLELEGTRQHGQVSHEFYNTEEYSSAGRMEQRQKRARGSNWNHAHIVALAELKREASLNKEGGRLVWDRIAQILSSKFPGQIRTGDQCRRRWETLVKDYNHIEDYCAVSGAKDHRELDEGELASMKLATAYQQDWYDIVEQVCSQRKRKGRCDRDLMLPRRRMGSHSIELPERPPIRDTLCSASTSNSVTCHDQSTPESTTTYAQVSSSPSLEVDKLSPVEEVVRLMTENDCLMVEAMQLGQNGQVSQAVSQEPLTLDSINLPAHTFPAEKGAQLGEPLQEDLWDLDDAMSIESSTAIEQCGTQSEYHFRSAFVPGNVARATKMSGAIKVPRSMKASRVSIASNASNASRESNSSGLKYLSQPALLSSATITSSTSSGSADSTISSQVENGAQIGESETKSELTKPIYLELESSELAAHPKETLQDHVWDDSFVTVIAQGGGMINRDDIRGGQIAHSTRTNSSRSADSTISRPSRRWSLKMILLKFRQCCHACGRKVRTEDMESKQAARLQPWLRARLEGKARKKALMSRKENDVAAMLNAVSSTSATSATRGDKRLQKDTERTSKQAALDQKEEETRSRKAERQQLGRKSSTKCVPLGKVCAELSRRLFPAFRDQSSH